MTHQGALLRVNQQYGNPSSNYGTNVLESYPYAWEDVLYGLGNLSGQASSRRFVHPIIISAKTLVHPLWLWHEWAWL